MEKLFIEILNFEESLEYIICIFYNINIKYIWNKEREKISSEYKDHETCRCNAEIFISVCTG